MKGFVSNRWLDALIKLVIVLVIAHVILLVAGWFFGTNIGLFGLSMLWPHWTGGLVHNIIAIVLLVAFYFGIYAWFTPVDQSESM